MRALIFRRALWVTLLCCTCAYAEPAPELQILATDPAPDALLARQQPFFVRFAVTGTAPVAVTVSGRFKGIAVIDDGGISAPALLPGGGTGVVSFFYWGETPTRIDEVRLHITDPRSGGKLNDYTFPVALTWLTDDAPPREPAAWVREWQRASNAGGAANAGADAWTSGPRPWIALGAGFLLLAGALLWRRRRRARTPAADDRLNQ